MIIHRLGTKSEASVVLQNAMQEDFDEIIVIGYRKDKNLPMYVDVNFDDGGTALWMLEMCKLKLLKVIGEDE